ncbi:hypothetical protein [Proteocatella sphenisci]|uniref:hypothetical protein n=1 Tax=Proteocatella sphenisci TaxID=181070 RepID=UPI00049207F2|nr:hypothetical protein [Proteocatella sphenisci]
MKKKIAVLMSILVMFSSITGCSTQQKAYFDETEKMAKWESTKSEITGNMVMKVPITPVLREGEYQTQELKFETINFDIVAEGYTLSEDGGNSTKAYVKMDLNSDKDLIDIKDIKIFVDNQNIYISKNYFDAIIKASGQPLPEGLKKITQEYIVLNSSLDTAGMTEEEMAANTQYQAMNEYIKSMTSSEKREKVLVKASKIMDLLEFNIPVNKSGRTYTINIKSDQMIDMSIKSIDKVFANTDQILKIMDLGPEFKMTKEEIAEFKKQYDETGKTQVFQGMTVAKEMIKGSEITTKETFTDSTYQSEIGMKFTLRDMMDMNLTMIQKAKKIEKQEIVIPEIKNAISMEKYMEAAMPEAPLAPENIETVKVVSTK